MAKSEAESVATSSSSSKDLVQGTGDVSNGKSEKKSKKSGNGAKKRSIPVVEQKVGTELESQGFDDSKHLRTRTALLLLLTIYTVSLGALLFVYYSFPQLEE